MLFFCFYRIVSSVGIYAGVAKLVDVLALGASGATHESSSLSSGTKESKLLYFF